MKRKMETLLIAVQNNARRTNYVKVKLDNTQKNSICRLCVDKDKTFKERIPLTGSKGVKCDKLV